MLTVNHNDSQRIAFAQEQQIIHSRQTTNPLFFDTLAFFQLSSKTPIHNISDRATEMRETNDSNGLLGLDGLLLFNAQYSFANDRPCRAKTAGSASKERKGR